MTDIDLIPADYRNRVRFQRLAKVLGAFMGVSLLTAGLVSAILDSMVSEVGKKISTLQEQQAISTQQRDVLMQLNSNKNDLERQLALLTGLRSGVEASLMFRTIDNAISAGDVWFQNWEFKRAGSSVERKEAAESNGYFIILPADKGKESTAAWKIETHMTIKGQAKDHSALSRFVRKLFNQPEINNIKILNTSVASRTKAVNFNLAVSVNSGGAGI